MIVFAMASCQAKAIADNKTVYIHTVEDFADVREPLNSHVGLEASSVLESMYDYVQVLEDDFLTAAVPDSAPEQKTSVYPRIKKMADGRYIMFFQGGQVASRILYSFSDDLKKWSDPEILWNPYNITTGEGKDVRRFTTADAVVLPDGDIIVVCSYRASKGYKNGIDCGLVLKRSSDNGASWSEPQYIYEGTNWEPYLLCLPNGDIQCYFTDCIPSIKDSGTSVITSKDGGRTWNGYRKVSRQFKYVSEGHKIFTDQMPCVRLLNDGKTLFGFFEARLEPDFPADDAKSTYKMSLVYNDGFEWEDLGDEGEGPKDRLTNVFEGAAGYVSVFPSGETLISCNISSVFSMKLGDADARRFNGRSWTEDWFQPFEENGFWGATEIASDHEAIGAIYAPEGLSIGKFYLNHAIDAHVETIKADGDVSDWKQDHLFFLGSESPAQAIIRPSYDEDNLYLLVECKGRKTATELYIHNAAASDLAPGSSVYLKLIADKVMESAALSSKGKGREITVTASVRKGKTKDGSEGYLAEIAVPLSVLGASSGDTLKLNACLGRDTFTGAAEGKPATWMTVRLK